MIAIEFETGGGTERVVGTAEHPVFVLARGMEKHGGKFVPLGEIDVGDEVVLASGSTAYISCIMRAPARFLAGEHLAGDEVVETYNLAVGGNNTYFVGRGGLWVHNEASAKCKAVFGLLEHTIDMDGMPGTARGRLNLLNSLKRTPGFGTLSNAERAEVVLEFEKRLLEKAVPDSGAIDSNMTVSYNEAVAFRNSLNVDLKKLDDPLQAHHGAMRSMMEELREKFDPGAPRYARGLDPLLDGPATAD